MLQRCSHTSQDSSQLAAIDLRLSQASAWPDTRRYFSPRCIMRRSTALLPSFRLSHMPSSSKRDSDGISFSAGWRTGRTMTLGSIAGEVSLVRVCIRRCLRSIHLTRGFNSLPVRSSTILSTGRSGVLSGEAASCN